MFSDCSLPKDTCCTNYPRATAVTSLSHPIWKPTLNELNLSNTHIPRYARKLFPKTIGRFFLLSSTFLCRLCTKKRPNTATGHTHIQQLSLVWWILIYLMNPSPDGVAVNDDEPARVRILLRQCRARVCFIVVISHTMWKWEVVDVCRPYVDGFWRSIYCGGI